jgi:hypothetical protein
VEKAGRVEKRNTEDPYVDHYVRKENGELRAWRGTDFEGNGFNAAISQSQHQLSEFFERPEDAKKE